MTTLFKKLILVLIPAITMTFAAQANTSPETVPGATTVDSAQAKQLFDDGALFVDVRKTTDWDAGRIPDALHLDIKSAFSKEALSAEAAANESIVIYCNGHSCLRSSDASKMAVAWGFSKIYYYRDGIPAWKNAGYPVE